MQLYEQGFILEMNECTINIITQCFKHKYLHVTESIHGGLHLKQAMQGSFLIGKTIVFSGIQSYEKQHFPNFNDFSQLIAINCSRQRQTISRCTAFKRGFPQNIP